MSIEKTQKMCPFYEKLDIIFSPDRQINVLIAETSIQTSIDSLLDDEQLSIVDLSEEPSLSFLEQNTPEEDPVSEATYVDAVSPAARLPIRRNVKTPKTAVSELVQLEKNREAFRNQKLQFEREKFDKQYELDKKRLELEEVRVRNEFDIKKMEQDRMEKIAKYEIDAKYGRI